MSHSIRASQNGKEVGYISIGASNRITANLLYRSLGACEFDRGVSGSGDVKRFPYEQILTAKAAINYYRKEDVDAISNTERDQISKQFLEKVIKSISGKSLNNETVEISEEVKNSAADCVSSFIEDILLNSVEHEILIDFR